MKGQIADKLNTEERRELKTKISVFPKPANSMPDAPHIRAAEAISGMPLKIKEELARRILMKAGNSDKYSKVRLFSNGPKRKVEDEVQKNSIGSIPSLPLSW